MSRKRRRDKEKHEFKFHFKPRTTRTIAARGSTAANVREPARVPIVDDHHEPGRVLQSCVAPEAIDLTVAAIAHGMRTAVEEPFALISLGIVERVVLPEFKVVSGTAIIMRTGTGDEATRDACLEAGAAGYLSKPFQLLKLVAVNALLCDRDFSITTMDLPFVGNPRSSPLLGAIQACSFPGLFVAHG